VFVPKPSSQGRLEGATRMYSCVFGTNTPTPNGFRATTFTYFR
jgi:hypothetical protein